MKYIMMAQINNKKYYYKFYSIIFLIFCSIIRIIRHNVIYYSL